MAITTPSTQKRPFNITVAGTGYVGLSNAVLLAQHNNVTAIDIVPEKVALLNNKQSPIEDAEIKEFLANKPLNCKATLAAEEAYSEADYVIIATPTNYDEKTNDFDTSSVEAVINQVAGINPSTTIIIKRSEERRVGKEGWCGKRGHGWTKKGL